MTTRDPVRVKVLADTIQAKFKSKKSDELIIGLPDGFLTDSRMKALNRRLSRHGLEAHFNQVFIKNKLTVDHRHIFVYKKGSV